MEILPIPTYFLAILLVSAVAFVGWKVVKKFKHAKVLPEPGGSAPNLPGAAIEKPALFISYRRGVTSQATGRLYDRLVQSYGQGHVFKDVDSIPLGADFKAHLNDAVKNCDVFLAVIGPDWLDNINDKKDFVRIELEAAFTFKKIVIPIFLEAAGMPAEDQLPPSIQALVYRNGIAIRPDPDFHNDVDRLVASINSQRQ